ncbi:uncharacterized protein LOC123265282 [Cotesia glomerata]|uniref:uncharacterized protein LOC123265282 n=1 Tax=Cotesia glomerata TaxID=32391 RepID=UPI001D0050C2|nr:uncharacterized protein LOC123265282 [Cotesia glomerata]
MGMMNPTTISFTVQGRDTSVPAASSGQTGCSSSLSSDRLDRGVDPKAPLSGTATGSKLDEMVSLHGKRDEAIGKEDNLLEELQELLKETLKTIRSKRTVSNEVTKGVKEAERLLLESLVSRKSWKIAQRELSQKEREERQRLLEDFGSQRQALQVAAAQTPNTESKETGDESTRRTRKHVLKQANGSFTVATVRGKRQRTGNDVKTGVETQEMEVDSQKKPEEPFKLVEKKKKKKKKKQIEEGTGDQVDLVVTGEPEGPGIGTTGPGPGTKRITAAKGDRRPRKKQRPEAVLIDPGKSRSSDEVLRALRLGLRPEEMGLGVKAVRTARKGGLLIEFEGSVKDRSALGNKITEVAGGDVEVRHLAPTTTLVIDGMDSATTVEEVKAALAGAIGGTADGLNVSITKPNKWGSIRAFIEARLGAAAALETLGKVKVGWLVCRIRRWERLDRCYRCHGLGHLAGSCKAGEDRSGCCWRCGEADHKSKTCTKPPRCHLCEAVGSGQAFDHVAGSGRCTTYREVLQKKNG